MQPPANPTPPSLSILVISWNGWTDLRRCLDSVYASMFRDFEVVVVDNASTDGTPERLARIFPQVRVLHNTSNRGHTAGFNQGLRHTSGKWVLLLDADTEFGPDLVGSLVSFMQDRPDVAVAAPRLYYADGSLQETARNFPSAMSGLFGRQSALTRWFPGNRFSHRYLLRDRLSEQSPYPVQSVSAACLVFPRTLVDEIGAWDERYPGYWVDVDWCFRLHRAGRPVYCLPGLSMTHHEGNHRLKRRGAKRIWMFNHGAYMLYRTHYTAGWLDPRALLVFCALSLRTTLQICGEWLRPRGGPAAAAAEHRADQAPSRLNSSD